jgi:hypothetical protein
MNELKNGCGKNEAICGRFREWALDDAFSKV